MTLTVLNAGQNYFVSGGSDRYQFDLTELLTARGHCVIPFAADHERNLSTPWSKYFPKRVNFDHPSPSDLLRYIYSRPAAKAMRQLLAAVRPDIAHLHIYYGQLTTSILSALRTDGVPIVQTLHEYKLVCPVYTLACHGELCEACQGKAFWHAIARRCNRGSIPRSALSAIESYVSRWLGSIDKVDHFISVSEFQRDKLISLGVPADKISTVHNFIPLSTAGPNHQLGQYFLYFGRLERIKGLFTLLEAAAQIPNTPLLLVGDGAAREEAKAWVESRRIDHIKFLGFRQGDELKALVRNSLCTVLPSQWFETFGLTILESFASGRPVIASRIGGMTEVISDGADGFLVAPGAIEDLKDRLLWIAAHPAAAAKMGLRGRTKAETQFGSDEHYRKLMVVYQQFL